MNSGMIFSELPLFAGDEKKALYKYKQHCNKISQVTEVAKAEISETSALRIEDAQSLL